MKNQTKDTIKSILFIIIMLIGFIFSCWLSIGVMLIGGISAIASGAVGGALAAAICKIIFFEMGFMPFWVCYILGFLILKS